LRFLRVPVLEEAEGVGEGAEMGPLAESLEGETLREDMLAVEKAVDLVWSEVRHLLKMSLGVLK